MAFTSSVSWRSHNIQQSSAALTSRTVTRNVIKPQHCIGRRIGFVALMSSLVLAATSNRTAYGFDFRMTVPEQTAAEAEAVIRDHARALLDVKTLLEEEDWREAQRELPRTSGYLRQDIYTIIQTNEGKIRPLLRKLYSDLFNNATQALESELTIQVLNLLPERVVLSKENSTLKQQMVRLQRKKLLIDG